MQSSENQVKKISVNKNDLDALLCNLKGANNLQTKRPYRGHLIQQFQEKTPQPGYRQATPIEIDDGEESKTKKKLISTESQSIKNLFNGIVILFPCVSLNLTPQRINILIELIKKNGGIAYNLCSQINDLSWVDVFGQALIEEKAFITISNDQQEKKLELRLKQIGMDIEIVKGLIISCEWISDCLSRSEIIKYENYQNEQFMQQHQIQKKELQNFNPNQDIRQSNERQLSMSPSPQPDVNAESEFTQYENNDKGYGQNGSMFLLKKRNKQSHKFMKSFRDLLDYSYDIQLENFHQSYDEDEDEDEDEEIDYDQFQLLKEEKQETKNEILQQYVHDEECFITNIKKQGKINQSTGSLFEGINIPEKIMDVEIPIMTSQLRDVTPFNNPGFKKREQYWEQQKQSFVCETGVSRKDHNQHIIEPLERLLQCYTNDRDKGRTIAYKRAIAFIKSLDFQIKSEQDVYNMPTIGEKIKKKVVEILQTGHLKKAENLSSQLKNKCIEIFSQIWGVGPQTALMFYFKGMRSYDDLRKDPNILNRNQKIGLKYVHELKKRIPRDECTQIINIVTQKIEEISEHKGVFEVIACGSYRRGKKDCGDLDILITRRDGKASHEFLLQLVQSLENILLTDHLVLPHGNNNSHGSETYMGICQLRSELPHRRLDLKLYPSEQFGYAVLYFTGSDHFNRSMRLFAQKKGYSLSDHGLYPTLRAHRNQKVWQGELIPCYTEEDVFSILNITYKKPEDRSV